MKFFGYVAAVGVSLQPVSVMAQDDGGAGELVVTGMRRSSMPGAIVAVPAKPPVVGLRRQADSAVREIHIVSDSRDVDMRRREVQAMLLDAIDRAKRDGFSLVTGEFELAEVTRANWQEKLPGLANKAAASDDEDDDEDEDAEDGKVNPAFEDDGGTATVRLKVKTKLDGSINGAQQRIASFAKSVPATGRSQIEQKGQLALTIINPEQYRDELYRRISDGAKRAAGFYGAEYGLEISGLDEAIAWKQVSNTDLFLYIPYHFTIGKWTGSASPR